MSVRYAIKSAIMLFVWFILFYLMCPKFLGIEFSIWEALFRGLFCTFVLLAIGCLIRTIAEDHYIDGPDN